MGSSWSLPAWLLLWVSCLAPPPPTDTRVQGSDETPRRRFLHQPDELLAVCWLWVLERQLFATMLHQSQQEITMVPVTEGIVTSWGMWWSVLHNKLGSADLMCLWEA